MAKDPDDAGWGAEWARGGIVLVLQATGPKGAQKELARSSPLPAETERLPTAAVRDFVNDFRAYVEALGWDEVPGNGPAGWWDYRFRKRRGASA